MPVRDEDLRDHVVGVSPDVPRDISLEAGTALNLRRAFPFGAFPFGAVVLPWLVSRVLSVAVLMLAVDDPRRGSRFTQVAMRWDGAFYLAIARQGYGPVGVPFPRWPFFPGLSGVVHALDEVTSGEWPIFVVNQLALLVAFAGLYRLARRHSSPRAATFAVWAIALFPVSFVFSMTYPSALFLAASVWAFLLVEEHHDVSAGVLVGAAAMLRPNGMVVAVALLFVVGVGRRAVIICGPAVAAVGGWCWYCYDRTGDALVFLNTKARWDEITLWRVLSGHGKLAVLPHGVLAFLALAAVFWQRRRIPMAWQVLAVLYLLPSLVTGMVGLGRYANECFVPFVTAGAILERMSARARYALFALSGGVLVVFAFLSARYELVP
ncbi:MAG TPA: glycosyltransferase family 39 protein [Acidimicrobiia bacterium]